jgi:hypothetical protein
LGNIFSFFLKKIKKIQFHLWEKIFHKIESSSSSRSMESFFPYPITSLGYVGNKPCWQSVIDKTLSSHSHASNAFSKTSVVMTQGESHQ